MNRSRTIPPGFAALAAVFAAAMAAITPVDFAWTVYLTAHRWDPAVSLLRRTVFEGDALGGSDLPIFGALALIGAYLWATSARGHAAGARFRPWLGYLMISTLGVGLGAVHTVKWILGRARPYEVIAGEHLPFTPWYALGPHYVTEGVYRGSFPSGHTAAAFVFMAVAYALAADPLVARPWRAAGWAVGAATLAFSAAMAVASSMARSHWLSDAVGVVGIVWLLMHALYFWGLRVPEQRRYWRVHGRPPALPGRWELRLCGWGALALLGVIAAGLGLRAFAVQAVPSLALLVPAGVALIAVTAPRAQKLLRQLHRVLDEAPSDARAPHLPAAGVEAHP